MKMGIFPSSLLSLGVIIFLIDIPTQQMHYSLYWVFIMKDIRIWNLVKMTTHGLSSRTGYSGPSGVN